MFLGLIRGKSGEVEQYHLVKMICALPPSRPRSSECVQQLTLQPRRESLRRRYPPLFTPNSP
jgi:hypothetical protein